MQDSQEVSIGTAVPRVGTQMSKGVIVLQQINGLKRVLDGVPTAKTVTDTPFLIVDDEADLLQMVVGPHDDGYERKQEDWQREPADRLMVLLILVGFHRFNIA